MEKEFYVFILPWIIVVILYWKFPITDNIIDLLSEENKRKKTEKITHRLVLKNEKELKEMEFQLTEKDILFILHMTRR